MLHTAAARATALIDEPHDRMATYPTTPLPTARWRPAALLHVLHTWVTSWMRRGPVESWWLRLDLPPGEAPTDRLALQYAYLDTRSRPR